MKCIDIRVLGYHRVAGVLWPVFQEMWRGENGAGETRYSIVRSDLDAWHDDDGNKGIEYGPKRVVDCGTVCPSIDVWNRAH